MSKKNKAPGIRRKREQKTNYYRRLRLLKSRKPRVVVRIFGGSIIGQVVEYNPLGDKALVSFNSTKLKEFGWGYNCANLPAAYLTGLVVGKMALRKKINDAVLDIGFHTSIQGSKPYAFVKGALDGGLRVAVSKEMLPREGRLRGDHISKYIDLNKSKTQFSKYKDKDITKNFEKVKAKIMEK